MGSDSVGSKGSMPASKEVFVFDTLQQIIDFAIRKEQEAADFYHDLAANVKDKTVAAELQKMAGEEERHRDALMRNPVAFTAERERELIPNLKIADYTVVPSVGPDLSFEDAVNIAMHREKLSLDLYNQLAASADDPSVQTLFRNLAEEESRHKLYFESIWDERVLTEN